MGHSESEWKIPVYHRPIYTSGRYRVWARLNRGLLEPLFVKQGVKVAFSGHEHFYERIKPQQGITYFISGGAGSLRRGDIRPTGLTDAGFDTDYHFMLVEISGDELFYQTISRTGATVDSGVIRRRPRRQKADAPRQGWCKGLVAAAKAGLVAGRAATQRRVQHRRFGAPCRGRQLPSASDRRPHPGRRGIRESALP